MYLLSIEASRQELLLESPYFIPDKLTSDTLVAARKRGVRVRIIVPGPHMDQESVHFASKAQWGDLLKAGVEIFEYQPTMMHCKLMVVDGLWTSVGSSNLDNRSFELNCEANLNVLDAAFAAEQTRSFEEDVGKSRPVDYQEWQRRSGPERVGELFWSLLSPQL
jgi:cardiolipin synthase